MKLTHDITGISKIILVLLLLISFIAGALFSYVYTMGYYAPSEFRIPEKPVITILSVEFSKQDTRYFDVTVLNPSYSSSDVNITRIEARTRDGSKSHVIADTVPETPFYSLRKGYSQTFRASWNWANYTGIELPYTDGAIEIAVFAEGGFGATMELDRPLTRLAITDFELNQSISVNCFNVTVQNLESSATFVNITTFIINGDIVPTDKVTPELPYTLNPGDSPVQFRCLYNWTSLIGKSPTLSVGTLQGYITQESHPLLKPISVEVSPTFNANASITQFDINVTNHVDSSTYVDIDRITVAVDPQIQLNITETTPVLPFRLNRNASALFVCTWTWSDHKGEVAKITLYTTQGFVISKEVSIP